MTIVELKTRVQLAAVLKLLFVPVPANPSLAGPPYSPYGPGIEDDRALEAEAVRQLILLAQRRS